MLILMAHRVLYSANHEPKFAGRRVIKKWTNDEALFDFPFDIHQPKNWRTYLSNLKLDGKYLPRRTSDGDKISYQVYFFGCPKWMREFQPAEGANGIARLFPNTVGKMKLEEGILPNLPLANATLQMW